MTTEACRRVLAEGWFDELDDAIISGVRALEVQTGRTLGSTCNPLLVSVRSGAVVSMPGMMDSVLNVGMTDGVAQSLADATGDEWFAWDTARRFVQSYASIVLGVEPDLLARQPISAGLEKRRQVHRLGSAVEQASLSTSL